MTSSRRFKTISREAIYSNFHLASKVELYRPTVVITNTPPDLTCQNNLEEKINKHGYVESIVSRQQSSTGKVTYQLHWQDGTETQETASSTRKLAYDLYEAFEHKMLNMGPLDSRSCSPEESIYEPIITRRLRKKNVKWADYKVDEVGDKENQGPSKRRRIDNTPDNRIVEGLKISKGPLNQVPYYSDQEMIYAHWKSCTKCSKDGLPNGPLINSKKKRRAKKRNAEDTFEMSSEEERLLHGRLLLCITCSAATHEGCISNSNAKQYLRKCREDGEKIVMQFQCLMCLTSIAKTPHTFPPCDGCHQSHTVKGVDFMEQEKESEVPEAVDLNVQQQDNHSLYRCKRCLRAFHEECLPIVDTGDGVDTHSEDRERQQFEEYWQCSECIKYHKSVDLILTWRVIGEPADKEMEVNFDDVSPSSREYLIKWRDTGYTQLDWVSEIWLKRVAKSKHKHFCERQRLEGYMPVNKVVPKDYLTVDRILTAEDSQGYTITTEDIRQVKRVFVKYHGLTYDHIYWDTPPPPDSHLYPSFRTAYENYQRAWTVDPPTRMREQVELARKLTKKENYGKRELKQQPDFVQGGELMPHQLDGLNWLIYQWETSKGCVLADDMGLGKTIQIVTYLNYLLATYQIYPFAIVVPLSTATNWLREFAKWAPEMVVVPYYGSSDSRKRALKYEIFREGDKKLRCHVIIFTYESAALDTQLLDKISFWPVLVVDEAHRLKNDNSQLFQKLFRTVRSDHPILMTGTPLQNNIRELLNIMHFVDRKKFADVKELEEKYKELSHTTVHELHDALKPYFLRRTKDVVLKSLPPKTEIIVPVTMSTLQKEVYKDILEKNLVSYAQINKASKSRPNTAKTLNNTLMQLRKTLGHPYLLPDIEIKQKDAATTQQVLIDACSKLKVLHQMLRKLKRDGHRVLIFSTFKGTLDIIEDYLTYEQYKYVRIDGDTSSSERVTSIDQFNARDSDLFVFLLTTRAGGVGINLATADTVIMWDFDFNPHADLQAICRAYRIGQTRPVLVLRFMTRLSAEEKIAQIAKKKMVLDHLVVDKMDDDDLEEGDVEGVIKFGAQALFEGDDSKRITYDSVGIDKLLSRNTIVIEDKSIDDPEQPGSKPMSFSFAKVWNQENNTATDDLSADGETDRIEDDDFWRVFLESKKLQVEAEKQKTEELGRGARKRRLVSYSDDPGKPKKGKKSGKQKGKKLGYMEEQEDPDYQFEEQPELAEEFENELHHNQKLNDGATGVPYSFTTPTVAPPAGTQQHTQRSFSQFSPEDFSSVLNLFTYSNGQRNDNTQRAYPTQQLQQSRQLQRQQASASSYSQNRVPHTSSTYPQHSSLQSQREGSIIEGFTNYYLELIGQKRNQSPHSSTSSQSYNNSAEVPLQPSQSQIRLTETTSNVQVHRFDEGPNDRNYTIQHFAPPVPRQPVIQHPPSSRESNFSFIPFSNVQNVSANQYHHFPHAIPSRSHITQQHQPHQMQQSQQLGRIPQCVSTAQQQVPRSPLPVQQQPILAERPTLPPNIEVQQNHHLAQNNMASLHNQLFHAYNTHLPTFPQSRPPNERTPREAPIMNQSASQPSTSTSYPSQSKPSMTNAPNQK